MVKAWMGDKGTWLFDLAHNDLDSDAIVKGFLKHYVLQDQGISNVQQDLHFHTLYGDAYLEIAMSNLKQALMKEVDAPPRSEMMTLKEVNKITQSVIDRYETIQIRHNPEICNMDNPSVKNINNVRIE